MSSITASALSGLQAASMRASVAAQNTANALSKNFKALDYTQTANGTGGVAASVVVRNPATVQVANAQGGVDILPNVALEEEAVNLQLATYDFKANAMVLSVQNKLSKDTIDILA